VVAVSLALFLGEGEDTIYLTFDEGYEYGLTGSILDTLQEKDVKAVFFVTEHYAKSQPELVQRIIDEGHVLGNHSASHPSAGLVSLSKTEQENEVMENHNYVLEQFGYSMYLFRYPAGRFSEQSLAIVNNCNYKSVFWSFAYVDYDVENQPDPAESLAKLEERLHPGAIYLLHAESETNASILGELIDYAREQGYSFGTL
jgi:delta-lactam-biosynthetic de-N-acetylase